MTEKKGANKIFWKTQRRDATWEIKLHARG